MTMPSNMYGGGNFVMYVDNIATPQVAYSHNGVVTYTKGGTYQYIAGETPRPVAWSVGTHTAILYQIMGSNVYIPVASDTWTVPSGTWTGGDPVTHTVYTTPAVDIQAQTAGTSNLTLWYRPSGSNSPWRWG
jgi:hypothetical protein